MSAQSRSLKQYLLKRSQRCCFCRRALTFSTATIEHIKPKSEGGRLVKENAALSCSGCNTERGVVDFEEFKAIKRAVLKAIRETRS